MNILIAGFPYIRKNYLETFEYYPQKDNINFLLPKSWKVKGGRVVYFPPDKTNVYKTSTFFHHSNYPFVGGVLKGWMPLFPLFLMRLKRSKKIDLVYSCSEPILLTTLYQGIWSKLFGLKHIIFTWENIPYDKKFKGPNLFIKRLLIKLNLLFSDGIICGNSKGAEIHRRFTNKPVAIIPMNGLDDNFFQQSQKRNSDKVTFIFIGAIGYRKGIHLIVKAFKEITENNFNAELIIAGSGEYEKEIDKLIEDLNIRDKVQRIPWVDHNDLVDLLSKSDIFLYPSISYGGWEEQFGYSMAEASLMELPVISTDSGSIKDVVLDDKTGILVDENNVDALREAMIKLANNSQLREKMGKEGRVYIKNNFSHKIVAHKFFDFFQSFREVK